MEPLHLGVDAGNSKTVALLCDEDGRVVGYARSGNGDIYGAESAAAAVDAVVAAVKDALTTAGAREGDVRASAFRLAGVDWPEDHAYWMDALARRLPALRTPSVLNDGFAAIRCGGPGGAGVAGDAVGAIGAGVAVIGGTGSAVAGRGPTGTEWSMSFWIQDAHGASGLVGSALRAVYRAELDLGPATALTARLLAFFGATDVEALLHSFTGRETGHGWARQAAAAREVVAAAVEGDEVAAALVLDQGRHLADYARVTARRVGFAVDAVPADGVDDADGVDAGPGVPVVLAGPVLCAAGSPVTAALLDALPRVFPAARPRLATLPPVSGAVLDALADAGVGLVPAVYERLRDTAPPPAFLAT
ncbi:BadF-type ATPase [Actinopolymorpha cephalotaxi]|uniref:BadF-type ATPase n=1 Tax=Actinopolymorpha cephalotaxi TaxID=504797 RepID=A0A1I2ULG7_9ACTN|nr:BadF/BadG/BcrA/BcrD ATPase family protein [Actinopolymorpha cephalotaxi]NYH86616.1 N-acetylglucosamine kinase-like BadF-type ATPase [Actinopolymorpha cephalotaxi]SFG77139.1 BadF-type ATPase [Actinopolymorpha cephalotaxi]